MENQTRLEDFERDYVLTQDDLSEDRPGGVVISEGEYFINTLNATSQNILTDEYVRRNRSLIENFVSDLYQLDQLNNQYPPEVSGRILELFFSSVSRHGMR